LRQQRARSNSYPPIPDAIALHLRGMRPPGQRLGVPRQAAEIEMQEMRISRFDHRVAR
jgi:hypothetical protein